MIGLAGGVGAGKSAVARLFAEMGAAVIEADKINHEELSSPDVVATIRSWWGEKAVDGYGQSDRRKIAEIVFADVAQRKRLEQLIHPRVARRRSELIARYDADPNVRAIVLDTPLLFEAGLADECDTIVFVAADRGIRMQRVAASRGWSAEELERRENAQTSVEFKRDSADYVVQNDSSVDALVAEVRRVFSCIVTRDYA